jgi:hypothetical protein
VRRANRAEIGAADATTTGRRVTHILGAGVTVVTDDRLTALAAERSIAGLDSVARVAIVTGKRAGFAGSGSRIAAVGSAGVTVVAVGRAVAAGAGRAGVDRAQVAVVAIGVFGTARSRPKQRLVHRVRIVGAQSVRRRALA